MYVNVNKYILYKPNKLSFFDKKVIFYIQSVKENSRNNCAKYQYTVIIIFFFIGKITKSHFFKERKKLNLFSMF